MFSCRWSLTLRAPPSIYNNDFQLNNAMFYIELRGYGFIVNSPRLNLRVALSVGRPTPCTDKKEKKIVLIYKVIQSGAVAKSYMRKAS
jgi:hypothetical protein